MWPNLKRAQMDGTMDTKPDLLAIRRDIDALDANLRELLKARAGLVAKVAASKAQSGDARALRPAREAAQLAELKAWQETQAPELPLAGLTAIWREIIGMALNQQGGLTIFATPEAMPAARAYFGASLDYQLCDDAGAVQFAIAGEPRAVGVVLQGQDAASGDGVSVFAELASPDGAEIALCYGTVAEEAAR
jgi:chorismate mutase